MKKFLVFMALLGGIVATPTVAAEITVSEEIKVESSVDAYVKKG